ncbi:hypothetical protein DPMN_089709 [Dreissena polymorpha]|uniref:Uncharacterized protein n=1 Tax=Dreissena polymorpha TaxID=45954 RepID=A0A9D4KWF5_DREPO|nr:hypothetical protein DPMN_089709 [Dreissena polymorpha]
MGDIYNSDMRLCDETPHHAASLLGLRWLPRPFLTRKNAPHPGSHVFQQTGILFKLFQDIIGMNIILTMFHEDRTVNVASRVKCPAPWKPYWTITVASREKCPTPGGHVFKATKTILELIKDIKTNLLTKFHENRKINVTSRVLIRKHSPPPWWLYINVMNLLTEKNAPFELIEDTNKTYLLTIFHEDWTINVASRVLTRINAPPPDNIGTNLLTKFHEDRKINVSSRVLTRQNKTPPGGHVFQPKGMIFLPHFRFYMKFL